MGFSFVGAFAILGVTLMIAFEIFTGSLLPAVSNVNYSLKHMKDRTDDISHTNITIDSIITTANVSNYDLNISVKNVGSITLKAVDFNILVNGSSKTFSFSDSYLYPENTIYFNVFNLPGEGNRKLKIISPNGVSDYIEYTIST